MKNYEEDFKKFKIDPLDLPNYENAEKYAQNFKRCTIYKDVKTTYSNISNLNECCLKVKHA